MKTVFLWAKGVDNVLLGEPKVAGVPLQMSMWAKAFLEKGWRVQSISSRIGEYIVDDVRFVQIPHCSPRWVKLHLGFVGEIIESYKFLKKIKPDMVFTRAMTLDLLTLAVCSKLLNFKFVFFGASDEDFLPRKQSKWNFNHGLNKYYRESLRIVRYIVTQNRFQSDSLMKHYGQDSIIIPNIWSMGVDELRDKEFDVIWVGNLRRLKRAEWFLNLAKMLPQCRFALVGGVAEQDYYDEIKSKSDSIDNLDFKGACNLQKTNELISKSRILACTSEFEGFPNTFLQAWSYNVPVISTVDPSDVIKNNNLGLFVLTEDDFLVAVKKILSEKDDYNDKVKSIKQYFLSNHSADIQLDKLLSWINDV